ncbi:hypothetical protein FRB98_000760 [Tulasnella sp. 332]|nr:hypothetical protein FRB98_000760 [Tulasnella sp. 332]
MVFAESLYHLSPFAQRRKHQRIPVPPTLTHALLILGLLLTLSNLALVFDTWLHTSSSAKTVELLHPHPVSDATLFGKQINETLCAYYATNPAGATDPLHPDLPQLCGLYVPGLTDDSYSIPEGLLTLSNSSKWNRVAFTQDRHAILIPTSLPSDVQYVANTVGVFSACSSITARCINPENHTTSLIDGLPWLNCTGSPLVDVDSSLLNSQSGLELFGVVNATGYMVSGNAPPSAPWAYQQIKSNPFSLVGPSIVTIPPGQKNQSSDQGYFTDSGYYFGPGGALGINLLYCNVTVRDVTYLYNGSGSSFQSVSYQDSSLRTTRLVATLSDSGIISLNMFALLQTDVSAEDYALELSRELIGMSGWIWEPAQVLTINRIEQALGTEIHATPLILYLVTAGFMWILTWAVCVHAIVGSYKVPFTHLAQIRLTSLLSMIHLLFGPIDAVRTWTESGTHLFSVESESHRLKIGPIEMPGGVRSFGVTMTEVEVDSAPPTDREESHNVGEIRRCGGPHVPGVEKRGYLIPDLRFSPAFPTSDLEHEESHGLLDRHPM